MGNTILERLRIKKDWLQDLTMDFVYDCGNFVQDDYLEDIADIDYEKILYSSVTHAKQEIEKYQTGKYDNSIFQLNICYDYKCLLLTIHGIIEDYNAITVNRNLYIDIEAIKNDFALVTKWIAKISSLQVDKDIVTILADFICKLNNEYEKEIMYLPELFERLGDRALFFNGDIDRALLWYSLLEINNNIFSEKELLKNEKSRRFSNNIRFLLSLNSEDEFHTFYIGHESGFDMSFKLQDLLRKFLDEWGKYQGNLEGNVAQNIWDTAVDFSQEVSRELTETNFEKITNLRTQVAAALVLLYVSTYYYLVSLSALTYDIIDAEEKELVISLLNIDSQIADKKLLIIKDYWNSENSSSTYRVRNVLRLAKALALTERILSILRMNNYKGKIAYYTSLDTFQKMLPSGANLEENIGKFAIMHVAYMNDPNEGKVLARIVMRDKLEKSTSGRNKADYPYVFIKCFTDKIDSLPMWEMYGNHAQGCCIVLDIEKLNRTSKKILPIYNVCYINTAKDDFFVTQEDNEVIADYITDMNKLIYELRSISNIQSNSIYNDAFMKIVSRITYLFKNSDYAYECEKRILYSVPLGVDESIYETKTNDGNKSPLLYIVSDINLSIDELILGPKCENIALLVPYLQRQMDKMLEKIDYNGKVEITHSAIDYR